MAKMLDCNCEVSLKLTCVITLTFGLMPLDKVLNPLIPPVVH